MKIFILAASIAATLSLTPAHACGGYGILLLPDLAGEAVADNADLSKAAITRLRHAGQRGLDALMTKHKDLIATMRSGETPLNDPAAAKLRRALDAVARQRDAHASGLYWYTDLELARGVAKASGKRVLSLRLLGNLDEEFSCANSRFFRTALYANKDVSEYLRQNYVLHWKSVRPVPKITIDMGDGRRIERTITGNSIHYVLGGDGTVHDAIPGLYGPAAFLETLKRSDTLAKSLPDPDPAASLTYVSYHGDAADKLCRTWLADTIRAGAFGDAAAAELQTDPNAVLDRLARTAFPNSTASRPAPVPRPTSATALRTISAGPTLDPLAEEPKGGPAPGQGEPRHNAQQQSVKPNPTATKAAPRAIGKMMMEAPILRRTMPDGEALKLEAAAADPTPGKTLPDRMTPALWKKIAESRAAAVKLDEASRRFMISKLPGDAIRADERAAGGVVDPTTPFAKTLRNFELAMAEDTVRNEYLFHTQIHQWLEDTVQGPKLARDVEALNTKVYTELFLTPDHDAWLGLVPENVYTALEKDGCACAAMHGK